MRQFGFLEWKDIDFKHSIINVNRSSLYLPEKGIFTDETKNNSSIRPVKVPDYVIQLLKKYRLQQKEQRLKLGDQRQDSGRILVQWNGAPIHPSTVTSWFHKFICNSDLPDIHLHSMRHTNITLQIAGVHMPLQESSKTADDGASAPLEWCTASAEMVHGGRERGAPDRHAGNYSGMPLRFRMDSPSIWMV